MTKTPTEEAVDLEGLQRLFERIPPGPYDALHRQDGWEVRQIDTDPGNKHHWPYRLCERISGQTAECDDAVFPFIAGVINAWPTLLSELARLQAERDRAVDDWCEINGGGVVTTDQIEEAGRRATEALPPPVKEAEPEPVAWAFELAGGIDANGKGCHWTPHLSWTKPTVPHGMIRNLRALSTTPPSPEAVTMGERTDIAGLIERRVIELAIHRWIRDDASLAIKLTITPAMVQALAERILRTLETEQ